MIRGQKLLSSILTCGMLIIVACAPKNDRVSISDSPYVSIAGRFSIQFPPDWYLWEDADFQEISARLGTGATEIMIQYRMHDSTVSMRQVLEIEAAETEDLSEEYPLIGILDEALNQNYLIYESDSTWSTINGIQVLIISNRETALGVQDSTYIYQSLTYRMAIGAKQYDISYTAFEDDFETYLEFFMGVLESFKA